MSSRKIIIIFIAKRFVGEQARYGMILSRSSGEPCPCVPSSGKRMIEGTPYVDLAKLATVPFGGPSPADPPVLPLFPEGRLARIYGLYAKTLLYAQEAVVLGRPLAPSWRAGLDLSAPQCHSDVGDGGIFRLTGTVANHHTEAG